MGEMDKPKIIEHVHKPLDFTLFDARWIPCSAKFVVLGNYARGTGALQIYEVSKGSVNLMKNVSTCTNLSSHRSRVVIDPLFCYFHFFLLSLVFGNQE